MKTYKDIGELYKDNFVDFTQQPPQNVWNNLQKHYHKPIWTNIKLWIGISSFVVVAAFISFLFYTQKEKTPTTSTDVLTSANKQLIVADTMKRIAEESKNEILQENLQKKISKNTETNLHFDEENFSTESISQETQATDSFKEDIIAQHSEQKEESTITQPILTEKNQIQTLLQEQPEVIFSHDTAICEQSGLVLFVKNASNVRWNTGENGESITIYPSTDEVYSATFSTSSKKDTTIYIRVKVFTCTEIFIPTAFTPNGDGLNDVFMVTSSQPLNLFELAITSAQNRVLVFRSQNQENGWDGTFKGQPQPHGLYFYTIKYKDEFGKIIHKQGEILLIRK